MVCGVNKSNFMKILINNEELSHKSARAPIPLECEFCHIIFYRPKNRIMFHLKHNKGGRFCSPLCSERHSDKRIKINCFVCNKEAVRPKIEIKDKNFCSRKCTAIHYGKLYRKNKVIKIKKEIVKKPLISKQCSFCSAPLLRSESDIKDSKTQTFFCNKSHKTQYLHKYQIVHKPRSRAEKHLAELIKTNFPSLDIQENIRTVLSNNLEIDIFIPSLKLCIELNGPVHYFPIWGVEKLQKVQNKDILKQIEINKLGLNLMVIDISNLNSNQKTIKFLDEYFVTHIKPILESEMAPTLGNAPS
jgi:hypothetical protein